MKDSALYREDLKNTIKSTLNIDRLEGKTVLITGATGMIGSFIIDTLMYWNRSKKVGCTVIAMGRSEERAKQRLGRYWLNDKFIFVQHDVNFPLYENIPNADFVIHSASTTHPEAYATEPISTITTNIFGTYNLLNWLCSNCNHARFVLTSSVEVYGQNKDRLDYFEEKSSGYIDCNTLRAGYPESKRLSEALCQAYIKEKEMDCVVARLPRTYGPTMLMNDTKALSQFIKKGLRGENIVLKSKGNQFFSFAYVADAASAILSIMLAGERGVAYNIADSQSDITLKDLAEMVASISGTKLQFELPNEVEIVGYSTADRAVMNAELLKSLGWRPTYNITEGITRTLSLLTAKEKIDKYLS